MQSDRECVVDECPGWREAWWWLGVPLAAAAAILTIYAVAPDFYRAAILPEGYGVLELSHFIIPLVGFFICLSLFSFSLVKSWPLLRAAIVFFTVSCFYIAGEEHSWGQWFFYWDTPDFWGKLNTQDETNLHNTSGLFNHFPQKVLELAILVGGVLLPLSRRARSWVANVPIIVFLTPPRAILPVALTAIGFKLIYYLVKREIFPDLLARPSEALETFYYMFILFYLIMLRRRLRHHQSQAAG